MKMRKSTDAAQFFVHDLIAVMPGLLAPLSLWELTGIMSVPGRLFLLASPATKEAGYEARRKEGECTGLCTSDLLPAFGA